MRIVRFERAGKDRFGILRGDFVVPLSAPPFEGIRESNETIQLVVVIGRNAKNVSEAEAADHILGYACGNDISARDCQLRLDKQWARGKSFDTFAPIGPWIETDFDPEGATIRLRRNAQVMQASSTSDMIFPPRALVSYLSRQMTLRAGTAIFTGTPAGIGEDSARDLDLALRHAECDAESPGRASGGRLDGRAELRPPHAGGRDGRDELVSPPLAETPQDVREGAARKGEGETIGVAPAK